MCYILELEATENKSPKGSGGIIGLTLKEPALARWFLHRPVSARYVEQTKLNLKNVEDKDPVYYHQHRKSAAKRWDDDVKKLTLMFQGIYIDPFNTSNPRNWCDCYHISGAKYVNCLGNRGTNCKDFHCISSRRW